MVPMEAMVAEYVAKIAEIQNQNDKGKEDKGQNPGTFI